MSDVIYFAPPSDFSHPFFGKSLVFTGALSTMTRTTAAKLAKDCGATIQGNVTEQTDFVILGDKRRGMSTKQQKAERLIQQGAAIQILVEADFLWLVAMDKK